VEGSEQATKFISTVFGPTTEMPVHVCSLGNERDGNHAPRFVSTRDLADVAKFMAKWDKPERGLFYCVGTLKPGSKREKANVAEIAFLHADIDFKDIIDSPADVERKLSYLSLQPSIVVSSGHGFHVYWLLKEAITDDFDRVEAALRQLADTLGGDYSVCEIARLMRLPGSHNSKRGEWSEVAIKTLDGDRRYELDDLEEWLSETSPIILRKERPQQQPADNPFLAAAQRLGFKPPLDVEKRLAAMSYMAGGDASIHTTQLAVSASLLNAGRDVEEVVATLLEATRAAAGPYGARWNWRREETALRKMCETWVKKQGQPPRSLSAAAVRQADATLQAARERELAINGSGGQAGAAVVNLAAKRQEKAKKKPASSDKQIVPVVVADGVIETIRAAGQDIMLSEGEIWIYADGVWHVMTPADQQWILTLIQEGFETLGEPAKPSNLTAAFKRLSEHPGLFKRVVPWADSSLIVCRNGVLEVESRKFHPHGPHWFARRKIGVEYDPGAACPKFCQFVSSLFSDRTGNEGPAYENVIRAWMGSALAVSHLSREERKALILVGPSRTGKTELSRVVRLLIGDPIATPSVAEISERFGLSSLYDAAAWIRDDAINEGDDLDPQRFKTIVTGEPIDIERKHKPAVPGVELKLPVLLTTNALPRTRDRSDAIFNRAIVLEMTNEVSEQAAHQARTKMDVPRGQTLGSWIVGEEGPGILNWALEGLSRLLERGSYDLPDSVRDTIQRFKDDNNPVGEWARTAITRTPYGRVSRSDLMCAYHGWQREQDGDEAKAFGSRAFFPRLRSVAPWISELQEHSGRRYITGLQLTNEGLQFWELHNQGPHLKSGSKGSSLAKHEVNKTFSAPVETQKKEATSNDKTPRF
jgi:P4 family phage/plasmid primase-like protien